MTVMPHKKERKKRQTNRQTDSKEKATRTNQNIGTYLFLYKYIELIKSLDVSHIFEY